MIVGTSHSRTDDPRDPQVAVDELANERIQACIDEVLYKKTIKVSEDDQDSKCSVLTGSKATTSVDPGAKL